MNWPNVENGGPYDLRGLCADVTDIRHTLGGGGKNDIYEDDEHAEYISSSPRRQGHEVGRAERGDA